MNRYLSNIDINYSWPSGVYDLNTRIDFLNDSIGVGTGISGVYSIFNGDNTGEGPETYFVDLFLAANNDEIQERAFIYCYADWSLSGSGSGPATLSYNYNGKDYNEIIYPNSSSAPETLVKIIEIKIGEIASPYSNNKIYEFEPITYLNTEDLSQTALGFLVHKNKDVQFIFNVDDRQSNILTSTSAIAENPFVSSINIDILDIYGNIVADNYISNSFANNFLFTEQENINVFGTYTENFGIGLQVISADTNIHKNEYYVYGNKLEIKKISISDQNGYWINENPKYNQVYTQSEYKESGVFFRKVTDSALYWSEYGLSNNLYDVNLTGVIPFAVITGECLKIDWGYTGGLETIFQQTGLSEYTGISSLSVFDTNTGDYKFVNEIYPQTINGKTYSFITGYNYPTGITGIYTANIYYSGINSTGDELIKTIQYAIPDQLMPQGKLSVGGDVNNKINFEIELLNDPFYSDADKFEIYANKNSSADLINSTLIKTIPVFNNSKYYSFSLTENDLGSNIDYWFTIAPYSKVGKGYDWTVGPYSIYSTPYEKPITEVQSINFVNGDSTANIDFITGQVLDDQITVIDSMTKGSYHTYDYLCQFQDQSGCFCSSKILIVDNTSSLDLSRTGLSFSQSNISDNEFINYSVYDDSTGIYLTAQLNTPTASFKLYKTSI